jgi:hypothetical protein
MHARCRKINLGTVSVAGSIQLLDGKERELLLAQVRGFLVQLEDLDQSGSKWSTARAARGIHRRRMPP